MITEPKEVQIAVNTLEQHKAEDIQIIDVSDLSPFCSHYVLATAQNPKALKADFDYLEEAFIKDGFDISVSDCKEESGWVILQGGDAIVHVFLEPMRKNISLEQLIQAIKQKENHSENR